MDYDLCQASNPHCIAQSFAAQGMSTCCQADNHYMECCMCQALASLSAAQVSDVSASALVTGVCIRGVNDLTIVI